MKQHFGWLDNLNKQIIPLSLSLLGCSFLNGRAIAITPSTTVHQINGTYETLQTAKAFELLEEGKLLYEQGRLAETVTLWQQALEQYQQQGESLGQVLSLNYLSLVYQDLGKWQLAQGAIANSFDIINTIPNPSPQLLAQLFNSQGSLELAQGQTEAALASWEKAETLYGQVDDQLGVVGSRINQAQALQSLGFYGRSQDLLQEITSELEGLSNTTVKITGLRSLGLAFKVLGNLESAQQLLEESLQSSQQLNLTQETAATLFALGNLQRSLGNDSQALAFYQQAIQIAPNKITQIEAQLNQLSLLITLEKWQQVEQLYPQIQANLSQVHPSRVSIYAQVNLGESLLKYQEATEQNLNIAPLLAQAVVQGKSLQDHRSTSYALGTLAKIYEKYGQWQDAQKLTEEALQFAEIINAGDISYQWQWQLARILKAQGKLEQAIAVNTKAVETLQSIRSDLAAINSEFQFSFQEQVEPVYRQLVQLLLTSPSGEDIPQENLAQAREVIESLQLAELDNFFRDACLDAQPINIDQLDSKAAVIYPIILSDRLAVIISLPNNKFYYHQTRLNKIQIENTLEGFLQSLNPAFSNQLRLKLAETIYQWLIKPAESKLAENKIESLVFVLDGFLRNLPMSALYDGQQYLLEKYNIALAPGLQLINSTPLQEQKIEAVTAGISASNQGFAALPGVEKELDEIADSINSQKLLNEQFTKSTLQDEITNSSFPVVHLATHGKFSSNPEETFVLTWDAQIKVKDFQNILNLRRRRNLNPVELLVLSACETALGDRKAALGLAGMAVRSGARSTIATLWSVKDDSTALLMTEFYQELSQANQSVSKAQALREAQLKLLRSHSVSGGESPNYQHPFYWAAFVLVGNWL